MGRFQELLGASEAAACQACVPGQWSNVTGAAACRGCPAGRFGDTSGASEVEACEACGAGSYSALALGVRKPQPRQRLLERL